MKKLSYIILALTLSLSSCENKLDEDLELTTGSSTDYTSEAGALSALVGAYSTLQGITWSEAGIIGVRGDDVDAGGLGDQAAFSDTDKYVYDDSFWMYNTLWESRYQAIVQITSQMDQLEQYRAGGVSSDLIDQYIAECKVLRAFNLLEIARNWEEAILMETLDQTQLTVKSRDELFEWISSQMDEAIGDLPNMRPNQRTDLKGGVTKYTALAIKALAEQELKDYSAVAEATGQIINSGLFSLYSDYYELFKIPGKLADENLLEIQFSDFGTSSGTSTNFDTWSFFGPTNWTPAVTGSEGGWGFYEPSLKYIKFMLDRGEKVRLQTSVLFTPQGISEIQSDPDYATLPTWLSNTTPDGDTFLDMSRADFLSGKHYLPTNQLTSGRTSYSSNKNFIVIRYAEILLMYAEAVTRGGTASAGTADAAVNLVRNRAGLNSITGVTTQNVLDEKYAELAMEWGIRYYDMARLENTSALSYDGRTFSMDKRFLPVPLAQQEKVDALR